MPSVIALTALLVAQPSVDTSLAQNVVARFVAQVATLSNLTYDFEKSERFKDGSTFDSRHKVKQRMPHTLYVKSVAPNPGQEILFDPATDPNNLVVHPNGFPYITLRLSYRGSRATHQEHHIATHMGYHYIARLLQQQNKPQSGTVMHVEGDGMAAGVSVTWVMMTTTSKLPRHERANEDEALLDFAQRCQVDPYWLAYNTPELSDDLTQELENKVYVIPNGYGARTRMAFAKDSGLLVEQFTWDYAGALYEHYVYRNVITNAVFAASEFSPTHPGYGF